MTHPNGTTGPQIGYAAVMADGTVYKSTQRSPALACADIAQQIAHANADRYAVGKPAHEAPRHHGQLHALFANANPRIEAILAGMTPEPAYVNGSGHAHNNHNRKADKKARAEHESGIGWTERAA